LRPTIGCGVARRGCPRGSSGAANVPEDWARVPPHFGWGGRVSQLKDVRTQSASLQHGPDRPAAPEGVDCGSTSITRVSPLSRMGCDHAERDWRRGCEIPTRRASRARTETLLVNEFLHPTGNVRSICADPSVASQRLAPARTRTGPGGNRLDNASMGWSGELYLPPRHRLLAVLGPLIADRLARPLRACGDPLRRAGDRCVCTGSRGPLPQKQYRNYRRVGLFLTYRLL